MNTRDESAVYASSLRFGGNRIRAAAVYCSDGRFVFPVVRAEPRADERLLEILQAVGQAFQPDVFLKNQKTVRLESLTYVETKDKR